MPPSFRKAVTWRSGLEDLTAADLTERGVSYRYEQDKVHYTKPVTAHTYSPDFVLPNGIIVETKGRFEVEDRTKHLLVRSQHPSLDIRILFTRSASPLRKGAKTTYGEWCAKHGIQFADAPTAALRKRGFTAHVPQSWVDEPDCPVRHAAIATAAIKPEA